MKLLEKQQLLVNDTQVSIDYLSAGADNADTINYIHIEFFSSL
jgi:hypothetical protein